MTAGHIASALGETDVTINYGATKILHKDHFAGNPMGTLEHVREGRGRDYEMYCQESADAGFNFGDKI